MAQKYRFVGSDHYRGGEKLEPGAIVELNDGEQEHFRDQFELVDDTDADTDTDDEGGSESGDFDAAAFLDAHDHWREAVSAIEDGEADGHLDAVRDAELARDSPRDSVLDALDDREA